MWLAHAWFKKIKLKYKAWNTYKATVCHDFISYTKCRNIATTAVKYAKSSFGTQLGQDNQQDPTVF